VNTAKFDSGHKQFTIYKMKGWTTLKTTLPRSWKMLNNAPMANEAVLPPPTISKPEKEPYDVGGAELKKLYALLPKRK